MADQTRKRPAQCTLVSLWAKKARSDDADDEGSGGLQLDDLTMSINMDS